MASVRRFPLLILLFAVLSLGTGALEFVHNLEHQREDAIALAAARKAGAPQQPPPVHNDSNCAVHAQLHLPTISIGWVPLLVFFGLFVAFVTLLAPPLVSQQKLFH